MPIIMYLNTIIVKQQDWLHGYSNNKLQQTNKKSSTKIVPHQTGAYPTFILLSN